MANEKYRIAYMCGVDYQHELDEDHNDFVKLYPNLEAFKANKTCWKECGIVKVQVKIEEWLEPQNFGRKSDESPK